MEETDHFMHKLMSRVCDSAIIMSQLAKNFKKKFNFSKYFLNIFMQSLSEKRTEILKNDVFNFSKFLPHICETILTYCV